MKKLIAAILLACTALTLVACGHECSICGASGADREILGEYVCDDCYGILNMFG